MLEIGRRSATLGGANAAVLGSLTTLGYVKGVGTLDNVTDVTIVAVEPLQGDINVDGKVNLDDYKRLAPCLAGPDGSVAPQCECFDVDQSGAIDLRDFRVFQTAMTGD